MNQDIVSPALSLGEDDILSSFRAFRQTQSIPLRDQLVCRHLHLVHGVARRFSGLGESLEDLIQEGSIGLLKAVDMFDPDRGVKFSTYACHQITSQIQHYLRDRGRLIRQPAWVQELNTKVARVTEQLTQELGRDPQLSEVAERLNLSEATVKSALAARELNCVVSLTIPSENGSDQEHSVADKEQSLASKASAVGLPAEDRITLDEAIKSLKPLEQDVVRHFFFADLNQTEIANKLGISVNYSSYLLRRSIAKLKTVMETQREEELTFMHSDDELRKAASLDIPTYDRQTGLYTCEYLRARIAEEIARVRRYPTNFALLLAGVQGVDCEGETISPLIHAIGQLIRQNTRIIDLVAYQGQGQFALLLPHTGREAKVLGQRLTQRIISLPVPPGASPLEFNFGHAVYPMDGANVDMLFKRAGASLAAAKKG